MEQISYFLERLTLVSLIDIALVTLLIFGLLMLVRGTRAVQLLRGVIVVAIIFAVISTSLTQLTAFRWLVTATLPALLVAIPVIFQPELRRALEQLGRAGRYFRLTSRNEGSVVASAIARASLYLSRRRYGALIVIEQDTGLQEYIDTGIKINADVSPELIQTVFNKHTELHDGAVIVRGEQIAAAACILPLSTQRLSDSQMGLRHRAAMGISEVSDAVVVIVSEETGQVSIAHSGRIIRRQDPSRLNDILQAFLEKRRRPLFGR